MKPLKMISSALLVAAGMNLAFAESKTLNLYVLTGQSNSLGAVKGSPLSAEMLASHATTSDQVKYWHENFTSNALTGEITRYSPSTEWEAVAPAEPEYSGNLCMGPEYGFAYMVDKKNWQGLLSGNNGGDFGIVKASRDGGGNDLWMKDQPAYNAVVSAVKNAVAKALEDGYTQINILGLMYQQGESNNTSAMANAAGTRLKDLVSDLKAEFEGIDGVTIADDYHVAVGENATWNLTGEYSGNGLTTRDNLYNAVSEDIGGGTTFGEWVPTHDLAKITSGDTMNVHYDGQSQLTIGARYAYVEAFRKGYTEESVIRSFDLDAALDSADAYHSGNMSSTEVVTWDVASSAITKVSETDSSVKLYGIKVDADAGNYLKTGATRIEGVVSAAGTLSSDSARLILGAGGIDIGKNLTLATNLGADASQTWTLAEGATLQLDGSFFAELSADNISTALITKEGAGTLLLGADAALGVIFDAVSGLKAGEYTFSLFAGFDADELSAFGNNLTFLSGEGWLADTMTFDAAAGTLTISYIPEPSALGLLAGTAALALTAVRRRRKA